VLAGDHLRRTWEFAGPDPLSDLTVHPFVLHQWLPDLGLSLVNELAGLAGVAWLAQAARTALCVALYLLCRRWAGPLPAALVAGLTVLGTVDNLSPRPQLVGFVLLAVTVGAWLRTAEDQRVRWWLVPLSWLWACSHGTWVVGVTVGAVVVAGLVLERAVTWRRAAVMAGAPALSLALAAATPLGLDLFRSVVWVRAVSPYIQEWRTPALDGASSAAALALAVLPAVLWLLRRRRVAWPHLLLYGLGLAWGLMSMRTVAVGVIIVAPLAAAALDAALGRPLARAGHAERRVVALGAAAALALSALLAASGPRSPVGVPDALNPRLEALPAGTVVYNADVLGGWLLWTHPGLVHVRDTRAELYGPEQARAFLDVMAARPGWERAFDAHRPGAALVAEDLPVARALQARGWAAAGRDHGYLLLLPAAG
jgi:hypothetical protein